MCVCAKLSDLFFLLNRQLPPFHGALLGITEYNDRLFALKDLLAELPPLNYRIVRRLSEHLER